MGEREAALARTVRGKIRQAANVIADGHGDLHDRLVEAWPLLRPLFPNTVPGQAGLTGQQRWELQRILNSLAEWRGAAANSPCIRGIPMERALKVADRIRWLVASLPKDGEPETASASRSAATAG